MSTPVCKVWDAEQGKYVGIPAIKGTDGHSPVVTATKSGKTTTISVDGAAIATVEDGADGKPGAAVTDDHINSLIDTKLGVIENGSY